MAEKKLKDLKIGDKVWLYDFTDTTPIIVQKKKRDGALMTVTLKWSDAEYECFGNALGWTCIGYNRKHGQELIFSSSFEMAYEREQRRSRIKRLGKTLEAVLDDIKNI